MTPDLDRLRRAVDAGEGLAYMPSPELTRAVRHAAGVPLEVAAGALGVSVSTLRRYEHGDHAANRRLFRESIRLRRFVGYLLRWVEVADPKRHGELTRADYAA